MKKVGETINIVIPFQVCISFYFVMVIYDYLPKVVSLMQVPIASLLKQNYISKAGDSLNPLEHLRRGGNHTFFQSFFFTVRVSSLFPLFGEEEKCSAKACKPILAY